MRKLVAFTGAGISKESGIPTFVELGDLRTKLSRDFFVENPVEFYEMLKRFKDMIRDAKPNKAHIELAKHQVDVVTMNVDGLHTKAGSKNVIEVHGNLDSVNCPNCQTQYNFDIIYDSIHCANCNELLQPNVVLYGDPIIDYHKAIYVIGGADTLLVVGTSFYTSTANDFVYRARKAGIKVEIINENAERRVPEFIKSYYHDIQKS